MGRWRVVDDATRQKTGVAVSPGQGLYPIIIVPLGCLAHSGQGCCSPDLCYPSQFYFSSIPFVSSSCGDTCVLFYPRPLTSFAQQVHQIKAQILDLVHESLWWVQRGRTIAGLSRVAGLLASFCCNYLQPTGHPRGGLVFKAPGPRAT